MLLWHYLSQRLLYREAYKGRFEWLLHEKNILSHLQFLIKALIAL